VLLDLTDGRTDIPDARCERIGAMLDLSALASLLEVLDVERRATSRCFFR
jgi:hypothetical protein